MTAQEFIRHLRRFARKQRLPINTTPGKGDHVKVRLGDAFTVLPGKRGELRKGTFHAICRDLKINPDDL